MTYIFNMGYKRIQFLFIFLSNYLISHFPFSAGSSVSSCERPFLNPGTYLFCKVSVLFLNIQGERTVATVIHKGSLWKTAPMSICGPMSSWWWHADRARFLFKLQLCSCWTYRLQQALNNQPSATGRAVCVLVAQLCPSLCNPMDCSLPGSSVHGILQARILEWFAISFSRGSSGPRNQTHISCVSCITGGVFILWAIGKLLCVQ